MKKFLAIALCALMVMAIFAGCGNKKTADFTTVNKGILTVSTNAAFPPYEMTDDAGNYIGIDMEIAGKIAEKLGLTLQVDNMGFTAALEAAQQGKSDMIMAGVTVNNDRLAVMDFSDSYAKGVQVVIIPEDSDIKSLDDLTGKKIGTQMGTTGYLYASDTPENGGFGEENVVAYDNGITAVQALKNGQIDCIIIDSAPAQEFVSANEGLKIMDTEYTNEDYAIGFAKGNTALVEAVNNALKELTADGTVQSIIDKYITTK